jgi:two-component system cell cycle sensor histidine kinase/response regulator CckA
LTDSHSILVVDDESESLTLLTGILAAEGYQVRSANSGKLALASIAAWSPQLILLDIRMPGINGFEVCRRLKASEETRNIPLMFISAATEVEERAAGLALGAVDYINKPFQREELLARVRTHLELGQLRDRLERQVSQRTIELAATVERLRESEERFRNMADTAPVMIWVAGPDKLCTYFNKCCLDFTGQSMAQKIGDGWIAGVHPEDREWFLALYSSSFDARREFQTPFRLRRADGEYRWVLTTGTPRFTPTRIFEGYIGSCVDITEMRHTQDQALARQKLESVGVLAGGIAHDFNNLLGGILAEAELAAIELRQGESPLESIEKIRLAAMRGAEIVRELMIYSGQDKGDPVEPVDLSRLVEEMLELLKVSISKHAVLKSDLGQNLAPVLGRASQIRQIVMNLIINASEAIGEKDGVIQVITSQPILPGEVDADSRNLPAGDYLSLEVLDTGAGMTEDTKAKIFDPFFSTKFPGRGLGLAVVQRIVRDHGGAINLVSAPGQGTRFEIFLPLVAPTTSSSHSNAVGVGEPRPLVGTILLVEDEGILRGALSKILRKKGLRVIEANDGSSALELFSAHKDEIEVMLLDMTLPGVSSREVFAQTRHMRPDLSIILTSAYGREIVDASFAGLQVDTFLRKPFRIVELMQALRDALSTLKGQDAPSRVNASVAGRGRESAATAVGSS